jgi:hypothetical protein
MSDWLQEYADKYTEPQEPDMRAIRRHLSYDAYIQRGAVVPSDLYADRLLFASIIDYLAAAGYTPGEVAEYIRLWKGRSLREQCRPEIMQARRIKRRTQWENWKEIEARHDQEIQGE